MKEVQYNRYKKGLLASKSRQVLKLVLSVLTKLVLFKHRSSVIVVTGKGQTSILRECIYEVIHQNTPARRNIETFGAEFNIPLVIFGINKYPNNKGEWLTVLLKVVVQIFKLKRHKHYLIIELEAANPQIYAYWMKIIKPKYVIELNRDIDLTDPSIREEYLLNVFKTELSNLKLSEKFIKEHLENIYLPTSKIRIKKGENGSTIVDARHQYFPPSFKAVMEIADLLDGKKIVFTDFKNDVEEIKKQKEKWMINPKNFTAKSTDVVVLRGRSTQI